MKILNKKEEYLAPFCEIELLETEDLIAASPFSSDDDVPPSDDDDWGRF
ncbi:MAG: hypothetical protein IK103_00385 [Bacteroidales bacterium]|jgi:hypothetical protein|nr:hypothetical protein [Bacteroidales bacterium]MBR6464948.1 hypothetical protein [Bacteroidales bacterium]